MSLLLSLWLQPQAGALVQDRLDRHFLIAHDHADVSALRLWLGTHEHLITHGDRLVHTAVFRNPQDE